MSLFYRKKQESAPLIRSDIFYKPLECFFWTPTPADEEEETSLYSHIIFLQVKRGETSDTSNGPYL